MGSLLGHVFCVYFQSFNCVLRFSYSMITRVSLKSPFMCFGEGAFKDLDLGFQDVEAGHGEPSAPASLGLGSPHSILGVFDHETEDCFMDG